MKFFRSVFALRLAIFPLVLNLTFSEEAEFIENDAESVFENSLPESFWTEGEESYVENPHPDNSGSSFIKEQKKWDAQDSLSEFLEWQENKNLSSFVKEGDIYHASMDEVVEDLDVVDDEEILSPSDSSFQKGAQENDSQMNFSATLQNDKQDIDNPSPRWIGELL